MSMASMNLERRKKPTKKMVEALKYEIEHPGQSQREIAKSLGITKQAVAERLSNGKERFLSYRQHIMDKYPQLKALGEFIVKNETFETYLARGHELYQEMIETGADKKAIVSLYRIIGEIEGHVGKNVVITNDGNKAVDAIIVSMINQTQIYITAKESEAPNDGGTRGTTTETVGSNV